MGYPLGWAIVDSLLRSTKLHSGGESGVLVLEINLQCVVIVHNFFLRSYVFSGEHFSEKGTLFTHCL